MSEELPEGWVVASLRDVLEAGGLFDGPFGSSLKTSDYTDSGVRVVRLENVTNLRFVEDKTTFISQAKFRELAKHEVREGDIVVGSFVDGAVRVCVLPRLSTKAIAKADCFTVRTVPEIADRKFVALQLGTHATRDALVEQIHGATRPRITTKQLRDFVVKLAPPREQQRIVAQVEALLEQMSRARTRLDRVPLILKKFRQAVLAAACSGELTKEWRDADRGFHAWDTTPLESLLGQPLANGRSVPDGDGFPVLRLSAIRGGRIDLRERKLGAWSAKEAARFVVKKHDFLVARGNGSLSLVGRGGLVEEEPDPVAYPDTAIRIRPDPNRISPHFLRIAWESPDVRKQIEAAAHTTAGIHKVSQTDLAAIELPVPHPQEQLQIVETVRKLFAMSDAIERRVQAARTRAERVPQAILSRAFSGELAPTEADVARAEGRDYEPASVLLERIRAAQPAARASRPSRTRATDTDGASRATSKPTSKAKRRAS